MDNKSTIGLFCEHHHISIHANFKSEEQGVVWLLAVKRTVVDSVAARCDQLLTEKDPSWSMLLTMLERVYEHCAASFVSFFTGNWASLEVVVRAVIEAAATAIYTTNGDRHTRLGQYLTHYFTTSRKAIDKSDSSTQDRARMNLKFREDIIRQVTSLEGIPFDVTGWPSTVLERFSAVGMEKDYRHIYAVLSGQVHNDAESLIDFVIQKCVASHDEELSRMAAGEMLYWMRFYLYSGLRFYAIAANSYCIAHKLVNGSNETSTIIADVSRHLETLMSDFDRLQGRQTN